MVNQTNSKQTTLVFEKRIVTPKYSIFHSFVKGNDGFVGYCRRRYNERISTKVQLDETNCDESRTHKKVQTLKAEDPRCFYHLGKFYVIDNTMHDVHIIEESRKQRVKIKLDGKNFSFISHNGLLYLIHYLHPLHLYIVDACTGDVTSVSQSDDDIDLEYRGGTPGYKIKDDVYIGFGHRTYIIDDKLIHDPFQWTITFPSSSDGPPFLDLKQIDKPPMALNICDPTCVIEHDTALYLVTAESDVAWFTDNQDYITNLYKIEL